MQTETAVTVGQIIVGLGLLVALFGLWVVRQPGRIRAWGWFAFLFLIASEGVSFLISPPDRDMGNLEKILYVHVPAAWSFMIAFLVVFIYSVMYFWKGDERHDALAAAAAEAGTVFTALLLPLGMIWARPTWGIWWTWDPRLTTTAITLLIYVGYFALRSFTDDDERRARWSAAVGILGFINVGIVYMSVKWWRTLHQMQSTPDTVAPQYVVGLRLNAWAFIYLLTYFVARRYNIARTERAAEARMEERALAGDVAHV